MKKLKKEYFLYGMLVCIIIGLDQISKGIVDSLIPLNKSVILIDHFFYFTYAHNYGAAWSMLHGQTAVLTVVTAIVIVGLVIGFQKIPAKNILTRFGCVLVFSGAIGNLIDRVMFGYVRDFIDFVILGYDFPIFNFADMAIVIGVFLLFLETNEKEVETDGDNGTYSE